MRKMISLLSVSQMIALLMLMSAALSPAPVQAADKAAEPAADVAREKAGKAAPKSAEAGAALKVNINTASAAELADSLDGIGPKKAEAIVAYRTANGPFKIAEDLLKVKGIGEEVLRKNAGRVLVK